MPILPYLVHLPDVGPDVRLADDAVLVGKVSVEGPALFAPGAVARGDQNRIAIGAGFYIGNGSTIHVELDAETLIGANVWVGNDAVVHGAQVGDGTRVEDGGLVLSKSRVGAGSIVAADSLVPEGSEYPENSYISGTPGRRRRDTTPDERQETLAMIAKALSESVDDTRD